MVALLATAGLRPVCSDNGTFDLLRKQVNLYKLSQLREATRSAIERGGLDKYGLRHDDEQRAVLFMLDSLLAYVPAIQEQHDQIVASLQADESKAGTALYGDDVLVGSHSDLW